MSSESPHGRNGAAAQGRQEALARLLEQELPPDAFFAAVAESFLADLNVAATAIWLTTADGFQLQHASHLKLVGLEGAGDDRHDLLLRKAAEFAKPLLLPAGDNRIAANDRFANPSSHPVLLAPITGEGGILEVWFRPGFDASTNPALMQKVIGAGGVVGHYLQNRQRRDLTSQQQIVQQLEVFARDVHASLEPGEVACLVANEGLRLCGGDRLGVALRYGRKIVLEAVSGTDRIEKNSNLVRKLRRLCERVMEHGDRLVFTGAADDSLPPNVVEALNDYLGDSHSRQLIVLPLADKRDTTFKNPPRSALILETFGTEPKAENLLTRLEVLGRHAAPALYNAVEHRQIPFRLLWQPVARLQKGLGGKARAITIAVTVAVAITLFALAFVPYPLKMDAKGQLLPQERSWVFSSVEGQVVSFAPGLKPGSDVEDGQSLILMHDVQLELKVVQLQNEVAAAQHDVEALTGQFNAAASDTERKSIAGERRKKEYARDRKRKELQALAERTHADLSRPGNFWVTSPRQGTVLNWDFREALTNKQVRPSEQLIRVGRKTGPWEIELKIPHKHVGQVLLAFPSGDPDAELDVDILLLSAPTKTFKGKITRSQLGGEAAANKDDPNDAEPVLLASVRIDGEDIDEDERIPPELLVPGTEVHAKVRCGKRRLGYALFYGVWEFFFEKVLFWF